MSDVAGGIVNHSGIDIAALGAWVGEHGFIRGFPGGEEIGSQAVLEVPCEILIPAALEQQITEQNAPRLDCKLVVEGANGPTTPEADRILADRGIPVMPDVLANAGGVTVSYYEWVQDIQRDRWSTQDVIERLERQMREAARRVLTAEGYGSDWRTTALAIGVERVAEASRLRAIFP